MLDIEIALRNYRCFGDEPARLRVRDGFTALVGVNNSGKSSMLRMLYELRPLFQTLVNATNPGLPYHDFFRGQSPTTLQPRVSKGERIQRAGFGNPVEVEITVNDSPDGAFCYDGQRLTVAVTFPTSGSARVLVRPKNGNPLEQALLTSGLELGPLVKAMSLLSRSMYIGSFRNALNMGGRDDYYDIATGESFVRKFAEFKSGNSPAANEAVAELIDEVGRIFGFERFDVNSTPEFETLQLTIDGRSYRLAELGSGIAHFIIVLVNAMVYRPSILLIDEPELNLHASLQLDFLTTLGRYAENGVIFATHSLGLARTAADRIYTFTKPSGGVSRIRLYESEPDLVNLLGQLSFDRHPDLGFSKVLLVEGRTEVRAVMQLLRRYGKEHEVLLLPLHGDDMIQPTTDVELMELKRIGGDIWYLIDSERAAEGDSLTEKRKGFVDLCARLGISGHVLERRALENYFTDAAISAAGVCAMSLGPYEKMSSQPRWGKVNNWRIASMMTKGELDVTDLGRFLASI